jgi:4-methyl-5(b-hydroxyethyl)-thiazole monophosphate biosynthesis
MEIIILVDILRRAKINVVLASVEKSLTILGSQRMKIVADKSITSASDSIYDLIILPVSSLAVHLFIWLIISGVTHFTNISAI